MGLNILSCATVGFQLQDILARALGQIERHCEGLAGRCGRSLNGSVTLLSGCGWWGGWLSGGAGDTFYIEECILVHKTLYIHTYIHTYTRTLINQMASGLCINAQRILLDMYLPRPSPEREQNAFICLDRWLYWPNKS